MGKTSGCILILAGLAIAAFALHRPQAGSETAAAHGALAGDGAAPIPVDADKPAERSQAVQPAPAAATAEGDKTGKSGPVSPNAAPPAPPVPPVPVPAKRPRTAVAAVQVDEVPARVPVGDGTPLAPALDRAGLTREIQRHLKRVGCYRGDVHGVWTTSVRDAMRSFTERANATLPVDEPDPVLLAMVQSHAPGACSAACPPGEDRAANGRCVPSALLAAKAGKAVAEGKARADAGLAVASASPEAAGGPTDGAPAGTPAAGPAKAKPQAVRRRPTVAGWHRSVRARRAQRQSNPSWIMKFLRP